MNEFVEFLVQYGAIIMLLALFIEQVGLPFPATPVLLFAGSLVGAGKLGWASVLGFAILGSLVADLIWFYIGALAGNRAVKFLCRISLEPDSCVRRTQNVFARYGMPGLVAAKFVPGLSTLLPPLAGSYGVGLARFLFFDAVSALLYCGSFILLGLLFSDQVGQIVSVLADLGRGALAVAAGSLGGYIGYKYFKRRWLLHKLRVPRITVDELRQQQEAGGHPVVLDLRSSPQIEQDPYVIPGAVHIDIDEVETREDEIPRDREVVVYCA
jgi:membrane protein DedA with SNARE-associated domain